MDTQRLRQVVRQQRRVGQRRQLDRVHTVAERARAALRHALGDGPPTAQRHARIPVRRTVVLSGERGTELTAREWEVAELVADGMSNKEIAAALVTSRRTAESHVENILRKLGFTTRTQVAVWVAQRGGPADHDGG